MYPHLLVVLVLCSVCLTDALNCEPFLHQLGGECHHNRDNYHNTHRLFQDASESHHSPNPLIYRLIQLYRFTHPCASRGEAAFKIFQPHNIEFETTWIRRMDELFQNDRNYPVHSDRLHDEMHTMGSHQPGCLTALLNEFRGSHARAEFFRHYPAVHQTSPRPTTTSTHSPSTTPTPVAWDCDPFGHQLQDNCDPDHEHYQHVRHIFTIASAGHQSPRPVIYRMIQLYRFVHPCASRGAAAYNIFHPNLHNIEHLPDWIRLTNVRFDNDPLYAKDDDNLRQGLERIGRHGGPGCFTTLLKDFGVGSGSRNWFFHRYPEVHHSSPQPTTTSTHSHRHTTVTSSGSTTATTTTTRTTLTTTPRPTTTAAAATTTPTPTTTAAAATTTPPPTVTAATKTTTPTPTATEAITTPTTPTPTTTTASTSTTSPTLTTTTAATTTTAPATFASTAKGYACTVCDELECLLHVHRRQCAHSEPYCLTTVKDTVYGRAITRSCADSQRCPGGLIMPDARCAKVEESGQEPGTTCHYCCSGHDCNAPPNLFPPTGFVGFGN